MKSSGRSAARTRFAASGMRGPSTARAKMKTTSSGLALPFKAGESSTRPLTDVAAEFAAGVTADLSAP